MGFLQTVILLITGQDHQKNFDHCVMKREVVAKSQKKDFLIEILASKQLCVIKDKSEGHYEYAALLKITNASDHNIEIEYNDGSTASFSFRAEAIYENDDKTKLAHIMPTGPIDFKKAKITKQIIRPKESHEITGYSVYILTPRDLILSKKTISGEKVLKKQEYHRIFNVDLLTNFKIITTNETLQISEVFKTKLEVFSKD